MLFSTSPIFYVYLIFALFFLILGLSYFFTLPRIEWGITFLWSLSIVLLLIITVHLVVFYPWMFWIYLVILIIATLWTTEYQNSSTPLRPMLGILMLLAALLLAGFSQYVNSLVLYLSWIFLAIWLFLNFYLLTK
jgi:hypothetical protein